MTNLREIQERFHHVAQALKSTLDVVCELENVFRSDDLGTATPTGTGPYPGGEYGTQSGYNFYTPGQWGTYQMNRQEMPGTPPYCQPGFGPTTYGTPWPQQYGPWGSGNYGWNNWGFDPYGYPPSTTYGWNRPGWFTPGFAPGFNPGGFGWGWTPWWGPGGFGYPTTRAWNWGHGTQTPKTGDTGTCNNG